MPALSPALPSDEAIRDVIAVHAGLEGPLLPILHAMQDTFAHIPDAAIQPIADALNISRAEVHGVVSFYHDFKTIPAGRHVVKICRAEACQAMGAAEMTEAVLRELGTSWHGTTKNGDVTIEPVYCLGLCANGPAAMVDDRVVAGLDSDKLTKLIVEAGA